MKSLKSWAFRLILLLGVPLTFLSTLWLYIVKRLKPGRLEDEIFMKVGLLPIEDHYYQPLINPRKHLTKSLREERFLPGISLNTDEQLKLLSKFDFADELSKFPLGKTNKIEYFFNNGSYESGDSEVLFSIIRYFKPSKIIEIGSGYSTLMARNAVHINEREDVGYTCKHICIEPYEMTWLESTGVEVIRKKVEDIDVAFFQQLEENDILFIDSSHIIRPQGDVLYEYLQLLPTLKSGVLIHIHDIFTPRDYLDEWVYKRHFLWNEQYLLEAFLSFNSHFEIVAALNYLAHNHKQNLDEKCPVFARQSGREPGAIWLRKI